MTTTELHDLIVADATAKALADAGNDAECAMRASAIAPKVAVETLKTYRGIMNLLGPQLGARLITAVNAASDSGDAVLGPVLTEIRYSLRGEVGVDLNHPATKAMLDTLVGLNLGLTADDAANIKSLAEVRQTITADEVTRAWAQERS